MYQKKPCNNRRRVCDWYLPLYNIAQILNGMEINHMLCSHFFEKFLIYQFILKVFSEIKKKTFKKYAYFPPETSRHCCFLECELHHRHNTEKNVKFLWKEIMRPMANGSHWRPRVKDTEKQLPKYYFWNLRLSYPLNRKNSFLIKYAWLEGRLLMSP